MAEHGGEEFNREALIADSKAQQLANELRGIHEEPPRPQDLTNSFVTSKGSIYTYDAEGHTARYKTVSGEQQPTQGIAVFVDLGLRDVKEIAAAYLTRSATQSTRVFVVEDDADGQMRVVTDANEVQDPKRLYLAILRDGRIAKSRPVSLFPKLGSYVFDTRQYEEDGVVKTERHLGHKVTSIDYRQ